MMNTIRKGMAVACAVCAFFATAATSEHKESIAKNNNKDQAKNGKNPDHGIPEKANISKIKRVLPIIDWTVFITEQAMMWAHSLYKASDTSSFMMVLALMSCGMIFKDPKETCINRLKRKDICVGPSGPFSPTLKKHKPKNMPMNTCIPIVRLIVCVSRKVRVSFLWNTILNCCRKPTA